jgi:hypothetical protein
VLDALAAIPDLPVCVELAQLGGGAVDERAMVRDGIAWLAGRRDARLALDTPGEARLSSPETVPVAIPESRPTGVHTRRRSNDASA